ncbi:12506_t:CDS:2 [Cetraspora pellucida]|uniref:12506_t:CDS:1 n=1 Tax=Cetraspora pellucida TaxID=1433469 RepID=A0A9N8W6Q0_9GLOM|nr:12506_t:CDS:2 [Cetraspora pellucida]
MNYKHSETDSLKSENLMDKFKQYQIRFISYNSFNKLETDGMMLSSNSYKVFSKKYNRFVVLNKIVFFQKYTLEDFINDLKQYQKVELHENILKFIAVIKQNIDEVMFIHEYANNGTLNQYLTQNFSKINWDDKLRLAKQLVSAVKCLHDNDLIHLNLVFVFNLLNEIINGKREVAIFGTPIDYIKLYTECWQHDSNQRPTIQQVVDNLNNINYNNIINNEIFTVNDENIENNDEELAMESSNTIDLLKYYVDYHDEISKDLELISLMITSLKKDLNDENNSSNDSSSLSTLTTLNINIKIPISQVSTNKYDNEEQKFLFDLNEFFTNQYNIQGATTNTTSI